MSNFRRYYIPNSPVFITAVCYQRQPFLSDVAAKELLLSNMREVKSVHPFRMLGYVILDDHFHWMILPLAADAYPKIMQSIKLRFTRRHPLTKNRLWQPRFWDHIIRDRADLHRHLDYIHFNPVKHHFAARPVEYPWSSFHEHLARGRYEPRWGADDISEDVRNMSLE